MLVQETDMLEVFILTKVMRSFSPDIGGIGHFYYKEFLHLLQE